MDEISIVIAVLSSSVLVAIIGGVREFLSYRREQKSKHTDEILERMEKRLDDLEKNQSVQKEASKFLLYNTISHLGQKYVYEREVDYNDRRILNDMHSVYHNGLNGNGDLDVLMGEVNHLPLRKKA